MRTYRGGGGWSKAYGCVQGGGGGSKNRHFYAYVLNGCPLSVPQNRNCVNILLNQLLQLNTVGVKNMSKNKFGQDSIDITVKNMISFSDITKNPSLEHQCFGSESIKKTNSD